MQQAANRANAQHSTGPRTEEGKAAASQNARKHGLSSKYLPLSEQERPLFEQLEADLRREVLPSGALQESIFRELAAAAWKRDVVARLLSEAGASSDLMFVDEVPDRIRKLLRHKADQDRAFNRALRQLKDLQTTAMLRNTLLYGLAAKRNPDFDPAHFPGLGDYRRFTKRSQSEATAAPNLTREQLLQRQQEAEQLRREFRDYCDQYYAGLTEEAA